MERKDQTAAIIGRFQVPYLHLGHLYLISHALQYYKYVVILLGESPSRDDKNPYDLYERRQMIHSVFNPSRLEIRALDDRPGDDQRWSEEVDENLRFFRNPILLHSRDSFKDHYKGKYPLVEIPEIPGYSGTELRKSLK